MLHGRDCFMGTRGLQLLGMLQGIMHALGTPVVFPPSIIGCNITVCHHLHIEFVHKRVDLDSRASVLKAEATGLWTTPDQQVPVSTALKSAPGCLLQSDVCSRL